jgi:methionyl-tRNA synthetase
LKEKLDLSFNSFTRTTDLSHIKAAQEFWKRCADAGDIYKQKYKAKYCVGCELEKTDSELADGKCPIHPNKEIEIIEEENYFFRFSNYRQQLLDLYAACPDFVVPDVRLNEIRNFVKAGLKDFSISRVKEKMPWGIPVPGDEEQVMYVWFDALVNYISCLGWPDDLEKFEAFWGIKENLKAIQVAGKDNLRQQSAMWQAMLLSAGLPATRQVFIHGFITSDGQKMSKSLGNVVDPAVLVDKYGVDPVRYYLLRELPPAEDGDFTFEKFEERYNADLAKGLGNLASRVTTIAAKIGAMDVREQNDTAAEIAKAKERYGRLIPEYKFNEALAAVWELVGFCDRYIEKKQPWKTNDKTSVGNLMSALEEIGKLVEPFMPETSKKIGRMINGEKMVLFPRLEKKDAL